MRERGGEGTFWGGRSVLYLGRDMGCMGVCICEDSFKRTLTICDFHCKFYLKNAESGNALPSIA